MIIKFKRLSMEHPNWPWFLTLGAMLAAWWMREEL